MKESDKEYYERLIDESLLFDINKDSEPSKYQRESYRMVDYLYRYLMAINAFRYEKYGLEIVETAGVCIKNYDKSKGRFLNYFNFVWHQTYLSAASNELIDDNYKGMKISDRQRRAYKKYKDYCNKMGIQATPEEKDALAADSLGMTIDEIRSLKAIDESKAISIDSQYETDDSDIAAQFASEDSFVDEMLRKEDNRLFIEHIESVYSSLQERQKPMMAMLITSAISLEIQSEEVLDCFKTKSCFDFSVYTKCIQRGTPLQNKEIAERFGVDEASVSRSWRRFKEKLDFKAY